MVTSSISPTLVPARHGTPGLFLWTPPGPDGVTREMARLERTETKVASDQTSLPKTQLAVSLWPSTATPASPTGRNCGQISGVDGHVFGRAESRPVKPIERPKVGS